MTTKFQTETLPPCAHRKTPADAACRRRNRRNATAAGATPCAASADRSGTNRRGVRRQAVDIGQRVDLDAQQIELGAVAGGEAMVEFPLS